MTKSIKGKIPTSKYITMKDGEEHSINLTNEYVRYACCDCGMVHIINFSVSEDKLSFTFTQDSRASGQMRRHRFGNLHEGVSKWKLINNERI